ncbi:hypothetical protein ACFP81_10100 [Deinococcus lacus]|uniref:DUF3618 domain-containing protein n=1 Tax=Deinococcus lacus TaxID=392561 RepID=A0ABW1YDY0_9DEIO
MTKEIKAEPVVLQAPVGGNYEKVRLPLSERELARERLRAKVDVLTEVASLKGQMQMEPLKMLGGASAVGAVLGLVIGSQFKRSKKIYVDAGSPLKYQKALVKAQQKEKGADLGGALVATVVTLGARALSNKLVVAKLEEMAQGLLERAGEERRTPAAPAPARAASNPAASRFLKGASEVTAGPATVRIEKAPAAVTGASGTRDENIHNTDIPGTPRVPPVQVEAKAKGSPIDPDELHNPNL